MLVSLFSFIPSAVFATSSELSSTGSSANNVVAVILGIMLVVLFFLLILGVVIASLVFWIMMLLHLTNNDVPDKEVWLVILVVTFCFSTPLLGAIAYYFGVKRNYMPAKTHSSPKSSKSQKKQKASKLR